VPRLNLHRAAPPTAVSPCSPAAKALIVEADPLSYPADQRTPLLIDIKDLAVLLSRSVASLHRDDAAARLPAAVRIAGSKRWRYADIAAWVELGCPSRSDFEARRRNYR
jgi:predicted DNA-binding transcriptional regulator AlpA